MLAGEAVIKGDLIMDPPAVRAVVQEMLSATRVEEDSYTLDRLKEKNVARGDGRQGMLHGPAKRRVNQLLMETISIYTLRWTLQRRGEKTPDSASKVFQGTACFCWTMCSVVES